MVIDTGLLKAGNVEALTAEIAAVKAEVPALHLLKVIIESATLTDDEIVAACKASEAAADYVKTSTGFHAAGWRKRPRRRADGADRRRTTGRQGIGRHPRLGPRRR